MIELLLIATEEHEGLEDRHGNLINIDGLPITPELRERLVRWFGLYTYGGVDFTSDTPESVAKIDAFDSEGLAIVQAINAELPDHLVHYFGAARQSKDSK
ncbi:MAG TPA: hypothetical protein VMT72_02435 [Pseudolabrys sp.]|nr:hypothetical protein [Pseudolabrys sp.]